MSPPSDVGPCPDFFTAPTTLTHLMDKGQLPTYDWTSAELLGGFTFNYTMLEVLDPVLAIQLCLSHVSSENHQWVPIKGRSVLVLSFVELFSKYARCFVTAEMTWPSMYPSAITLRGGKKGE